ncbi:hypothetical protein ASG25_14105 [Rhizobium sp. Leaf384]|uniref:Lnb N-terminal periplasmic domain-containing protein n=1 Tax=unclassified Rhizobium TaxID=2613769 RepID=UPI0007145FAA|nr:MULTISPECIES: DUF4105 domain-containing protein [unclassified Rhizobium]KQS76444.1 hypothetical protein ASG58_11535 [Rhizobium sp. Leaf383]KQS77713.1 hypothetical protein ASG25_14105 [Rhizobium sp. Leaf384]
MRVITTLAAGLLGVVLFLLALLATVWTALALWYRIPGDALVRGGAAALWVAFVLGLVLFGRRSPLPAVGIFLVGLVAVGLWWQTIRPRLDRDWAPDVARTVTGTIGGDEGAGNGAAGQVGHLVTLHNVRNFRWTSDRDAEPRWETRSYDLDTITGTDLVLSYWGMDAIAHTLVSFGFADGRHVAFSVEIRRETTEEFSSIAGFFKSYELAFIAADESDILYLRTNMRREDTYLYPLALPRQAAAALFLTYVNAANARAETPQFYDTLTTNCTTVIFDLARLVSPGIPMDWRILLSGYLPGYLLDQEATLWKLPERELRAKAAISAKAQAQPTNGPDYSTIIRADPAP